MDAIDIKKLDALLNAVLTMRNALIAHKRGDKSQKNKLEFETALSELSNFVNEQNPQQDFARFVPLNQKGLQVR